MGTIIVVVGILVFGAIMAFLVWQNPEQIGEDAAHEIEAHPNMPITPVPKVDDPANEGIGHKGEIDD